jgi:N-acetylneuraminate synthase
MRKELLIGDRPVGDGHPVYVIAEVGINHNGDLATAKKLIDVAAWAGCDAVKFQKRTPEAVVPPDQRDKMRDTPWGYISYLDYRYRVEFGVDEYAEIDRYCREKGIDWFVSAWDEDSVDFIEQFRPPAYKVASASVTDHDLLRRIKETGRAVISSSGMSTLEEIDTAIKVLEPDNVALMHATSSYPCEPAELNLKMITTLREKYDFPIGYSGHEVGLPTTVAAVALGANLIERHITLDRAMWGSDQAASVEPGGLERLVKYIRTVEAALGDGIKRVYDSELAVKAKLRRVQ